jgi:predicted phosphodiesterase
LKYAVISDIHGNIHAFRAVLTDALTHGVDKFLLLGDYASNFPYGNDVVDAVRNLQSCIAIRGNGEDYMTGLQGSNPIDLTNEQFKPVYWAYRSLSAENLEYLSDLPESAILTDCGTKIHLRHHLDFYFQKPRIGLFHSHDLRHIMEPSPLNHKEYLVQAEDALLSCPEALAAIKAMPEGVHLSGHNHLQFYMEYEGRLLVNPRSCGEPLDWDTRAAYTILTLTGTGWKVSERRVDYDLDAAAEGLTTSGFTAYAPVWSEIMELELRAAKDHFMPFVIHLIETGKKIGSAEYPVNDEVWKLAVSTWDESQIYGGGLNYTANYKLK